MMLADLLQQVHAQAGIPESRVKDIRTSVRYLARALGCSDPEHCPESRWASANWPAAVTDYLARLDRPISPYTLRNTRQNLAQLFRAGQALDLITPVSVLPSTITQRYRAEQQMRATAPYRERLRHARQPYRLPMDRWPPAIRQRWQAYRRERSLKVRAISLDKQQRLLEYYLGFLVTIQREPIRGWSDLFTVAHLDGFVRWQAQRHGVRITTQALSVTRMLLPLAAVTRQPTEEAMRAYVRDLPTPEPLHDKQQHWITLAELEQVGLALLHEAQIPATTRTPANGMQRAQKYQSALMLRLLVRVPLRVRNIFTMRLGRNLVQDREGQWYLRFTGEELKVSHRRGKVNTLHVNLTTHCPDLLPHLEAFLSTFRPRIPHATASPYVFLTRDGCPYQGRSVLHELRVHVYRFTQRRFYPHLIRTIWATEFISQTGDFTTAAYMLNDNVQTVLQQYQEILEKDHAQKASDFLKHTLGI